MCLLASRVKRVTSLRLKVRMTSTGDACGWRRELRKLGLTALKLESGTFAEGEGMSEDRMLSEDWATRDRQH